jgi:CubicO group peptidase (beta-lactamase class C family)
MLLALALAFLSAATLSACGTGTARPKPPVDVTGKWPASFPSTQGMDGELLQQADEFVQKQLPYVTSLLVIRHGQVVLERYYGVTMSPHSLNDVQSVTKSVVSVLVGIALARGDLKSVDQKISEFLPASDFPADPRARKITIRDLLTMSAGFAGDPVTGFDYTYASNWSRALLHRPLQTDPGSKFSYAYDSGTVNLLSAVLTRATGMPAAAYARRYLFGPMKLGKVEWQSDPSGNSIGGWGLELTAPQMAKIGYLYLHDGRWGSKQVVPADWVRASTKTQVLTYAGSTPISWGFPPASAYGYLWFRYPRRSPSGYFAVGRGGQFILVWPKLDLIVVTTAIVQDGDWNLRDLLERYILPAVR